MARIRGARTAVSASSCRGIFARTRLSALLSALSGSEGSAAVALSLEKEPTLLVADGQAEFLHHLQHIFPDLAFL